MKSRLLPIVFIAAGSLLIAWHFIWNAGAGNIDIRIFPSAFIMPSAYKVYENPEALDGRYYLFRSVLTNTGSKPVENVKVSYTVPGYIDWTDIKDIPVILPGQKIIVTCYPKFKPDIADKKTSSHEKGEVKISINGAVKKESFGFDFKGINDFVWSGIAASEQASYTDVFDNMVLLPCLVTPNDPIVKYYTAKIQQTVLKGETAGVTNKPDEMVRFLKGIYEATRRARMVYSSTGGVPEKVGDINSLLQNIRLPREVITGNTGLCIELSLLYASVLQNAGLDPVIYLIPGHAYPGFIANNQFYAIEATGIGGEGLGSIMSAEEALKRGSEELNDFIRAVNAGDQRYKVIYVNGLIQKGALAIELKDDSYMRQRIDQLFEGAGGDVAVTDNQGTGIRQGQANNGGNTGATARSNMASYRGAVSFSYPAGWTRKSTPLPGFPYLSTLIESRDKTTFIEVYNFQGFGSLASAMSTLQQFAYSLGGQISYGFTGSSNGFQMISGQTTIAGITMQWNGFFKNTGNGLAGIIGGVNGVYYNQTLPTLNQIFSTLN
jgi:hypothetical protein